MDAEADVGAARADLEAALGPERYGEHAALVAAFLSGRVARDELVGGLALVFGCQCLQCSSAQDNAPAAGGERFPCAACKPLVALHNRVLRAVLARIAHDEEAARVSVRAASAACVNPGVPCSTPASSRLAALPSAGLDISALLRATLGDADERAFAEAMSCAARPADAEDEALERRVDDELAAVCARAALLAQSSGALPDAEAVRSVLGAWARAYGLDPESASDEDVALIRRAVEAAVCVAIRAGAACASHTGHGVVVDRDALVRAAWTERRPAPVSDTILSDLL